jgi:D-glycero-alpha-D-manno-heptose 1-phosphate guanylyltransferase
MSHQTPAGREAIILAGGLGTRLRGVVADRPKSLAPVAGRPFLAYLLDDLERHGFVSAVLAVSYQADQIVSACGERHGAMCLCYSREPTPAGTGGAIRLAFDQVRGEQAFVLNGDTYRSVPYAAMEEAAEREDADVVIGTCAVDDASRFGTVLVERGLVGGFAEKGRSGPGLVNAGVYLVRTRTLAGRSPAKAFSFETDILQRGIGRLRMAAVRVDGPFIDIGIPDDYARAQDVVPALAASR